MGNVTKTAYPNVQENLKLPSENQQQKEEPRKTNAEADVQSMVLIPIHQDTSSVPPMTTPFIDLTTSQFDSLLSTSTATTLVVMTTTAIPPPPPQPQQSFTDQTLFQCIGILQQRMFEDKSYEAHEDHKKLYDALEKSLECDYSDKLLSDLEEACQKKERDVTYQELLLGLHRNNHHLHLLQQAHLVLQQQESKAPSSSKSAASASQSMAWTTSDTRYESAGVYLSDDEDFRNNHLPKADSRKDWWKPLHEEERPATPEPAWTIPSSNTRDMMNFLNWYCRQVNKTELTQADLEGKAYEVVKAFYPDVIHLQFQMQECHKMITDQVDWTNPEGDQVRIDINRPLPLDMILRRIENKSVHTCRFSVSSELKPTQDTGFEFKHDYTIIESPRAVVFSVSNNERKIMRGFNPLVHSCRGLSTLRGSGLRMTSAAAKPCQGDSSEVYLITEKSEHAGPKVTTSHRGNTSQQG
uniref:Uncharacterized protein n=1 Tax=Tanacetum cinerariifolium TaxID=118510 RepID=A0A699IEX6_TANCI|nr:hypothetical protein [Tanacetum cinerariifolium]